MLRSVRLADLELCVAPLGARTLLLRSQLDLERANTLPLLGRSILEATLPEIVDVIATPDELCLVAADDPATMLTAVADRRWAIEHCVSRRIDLPVCFDLGNDWDEVRCQTGLDRDGYLQRLRELTLEMAMYGFLPGFIYLAGLPKDLRCARKPNPVARVEAGSVAVGGSWIGIYGLASPGGWQLLGRTPLALTEVGATPPSPLRIGDRLRLRPIDATEYERMVANRPRIEDLQIGMSGDDDDD